MHRRRGLRAVACLTTAPLQPARHAGERCRAAATHLVLECVLALLVAKHQPPAIRIDLDQLRVAPVVRVHRGVNLKALWEGCTDRRHAMLLLLLLCAAASPRDRDRSNTRCPAGCL